MIFMTTQFENRDTGAAIALQRMIIGDWISQAVQVAASLGVADLIADRPRSAADLAGSLGVHGPSLYRLMRALASVGVFTEVVLGSFGLTAVGDYLRTGVPGSLRALATIHTAIEWGAWGQLGHSVRTGENAFRHLHGMGYFDYLAAHPDLGELFDRGMTEYVTMNGIAVTQAFDFSRFRKIVDVGGGHGALMAEILSSAPQASGIVYDLPSVVERADSSLRSDRCEFFGGDFFASVPEGGDLYLMASIVHDWDDNSCRKLLSNCHRAMHAGAVLLLVEMIVPPGDAPSFAKLLDLEMLVCFGGRERTEDEYRDLLAESGFEISRVIPTAMPSSVILARPV